MRTRKTAVGIMIVALILLAGCAGIAKMTPQERGRTFCNDFMTQYESLHKQSLAILASEEATDDTKIMVAKQINPKLNRLKPLIVDYCQLVLSGGTPSADAITALIADISGLFATAGKGGKK